MRAPAAERDHLERLTDLAGQVDGVVAIRYRPGGAAAAPDPPRRSTLEPHASDIEVLSEEESVELLRSRSIGRIALVEDGQPQIFPVNYAADDRAIVFRTAPGTKLDAAPMAKVAFEIDEVDQVAGVAWSVVVHGVAYDVTTALDELSERLRTLVVEPMAPGERPSWVAIRRHGISGRRFRLRPLE